MNSKIKNYVDVLFSDIPGSKKANELKEEILSNMSERFNDYIQEGKTENQAYSLVISSLGDIDEMLAEVIPNAEFVQQAHSYRKRNAKNTAIGVAMYIIGFVFLIGLGGFGEFLGNEDLYGVIGLLILLVISAVATGIIIYSNMSTPPEYSNYNKQTSKNSTEFTSKKLTESNSHEARLLKNILSIYWSLTTFIYIAVSFLTGRWGATWLIWVLAAIFEEIIKTVFEMRVGDE